MKKVYQIFAIDYKKGSDPNESYIKLIPFWEWLPDSENATLYKAVPRQFLTNKKAEEFLSNYMDKVPVNCDFIIMPINYK